MKWNLVLFVILSVHAASAHKPNQQQNKNHKHASSAHQKYALIQKHYKHPRVLPEATKAPELEVDTLKCPRGCVCQYAHFMDLPISRWINHLQQGRQTHQTGVGTPPQTAESLEDSVNDNEAMYEGDDSFLTNPFIKQATCILQEDNDPEELMLNLPHDLQALILLYTGVGRNKSMNTSILKPLNQLSTLEIRGSQDRTFRLVFDEPLSFLQHANFEAITLLGSDTNKRPKNPVHPSDNFDYKPKSELYAEMENASTTATYSYVNMDYDTKLGFELQQDEIEILPYDIYMLEVKKARMPTFYGWQHLEVLRIHGCQLNELYWEMFDGLESLQHLSLERNDINVVPAFALYGALHIKTLSLAHNRIHDLHYRALAGLLELEVLNLSDNRLAKLSELSFPPFPKLALVDFRNNPLRYIFPAAFWVMNHTRLMYFDSREMPLTLWANGPFESLSELRELHIGNVSIKNLEQNIFKSMSSLETLKLRGEILSLEFDAFAGLTELRELDLSQCQIHEVSMDAFMGCKKLRIINLARNNISYIPPGLFDDQNVLEEIYLEGNQLRTLPTTFFLQPKLRLARLYENPWKCSCDMSNWRAKIANQDRGPRIQRCVTDYQTGKQISCHQLDNFKFDHRFAPRCENHNGRSVFYVLRKQLQCSPGRMVYAHSKHKTGAVHQHLQKHHQLAEKTMTEDTTPSVPVRKPGNRLTWQIQREQKIRRTMAQKNSLAYVLHQEKHRMAQEALKRTQAGTEHEVSNDI